MSNTDDAGAPDHTRAPLPLPDAPSLEWLRKEAKQRLKQLRATEPGAKLTDAQLMIAREYGFPSWRRLKSHIDSLTVEGQLFTLARSDAAAELETRLNEQPSLLHIREKPYAWTLLHAAASTGSLGVVRLLLRKGMDVNVKEDGDNTHALHWAAAAGHVETVAVLIAAGSDVVGSGDDHELEVIGWATCWDECDDDAHRNIARMLIAAGARHHIYSAIALNLSDEVRQIVARDQEALARPMSRNEAHQLPLHFAVRFNRPDMVTLLLELGADPHAENDFGLTALQYAWHPKVGRTVIAAFELHGIATLFSSLLLGDFDRFDEFVQEAVGGPDSPACREALHFLSRRGETDLVRWLLEHGVSANSVWGPDITPLHVAAIEGHLEVARLLLSAGADPSLRDSQHDSDPRGWAEYRGRTEMVQLLEEWDRRD